MKVPTLTGDNSYNSAQRIYQEWDIPNNIHK